MYVCELTTAIFPLYSTANKTNFKESKAAIIDLVLLTIEGEVSGIIWMGVITQ